MSFQGVGGGLYLACLWAVIPLAIIGGLALGVADLMEELANGASWGDLAAAGGFLTLLVPALAVAAVLGTHKVMVYYWPEVTLDGRRCAYEGTPARLLVAMFPHALLLGLTFGLSGPWFVARFYRWVASQVDLEGERMTFDGTGGQIVGTWIVAALLGWVPIFGPFWFHGRIAAWRWQHTTVGGRPFAFQFDFGDLLGALAVPAVLSFCTFGLYAPWVIARFWTWEAQQVR